MRAYVLAALGSLPLLAGAMGGETAPQAAGQVILDEGSWWRCFVTWKTPLVRKGAGLEEARVSSADAPLVFVVDTPAPPADWAAPDFPDSSWSRFRIPENRRVEYDYGFRRFGGHGPAMAVQCLRGKFTVPHPERARGLTLSLAYRGGVVVCVNGHEVARGHLPKEGKIESLALAEDYPPEAFTHSGTERGSNCIVAQFGHPVKFKDRLEKRIRRLENVSIDNNLLRQGVNVLAVEIHRAPYFGVGLAMEGMNHQSVWSTAGLVALRLTAVDGIVPNVSRPAGLVVWTSSTMRNSYAADFPDPHDQLEPIRIVGCRNGKFDGKAMVGSKAGLREVKASASDLVHKAGKGKIAASEVRVLYTVPDGKKRLTYRFRAPEGGFWDALSEAPAAERKAQAFKDPDGPWAAQPIVIKVPVSADALPGDYGGTLTITVAGARPVEIPVQLSVHDWKLPDPQDFAVHLGVIQSPESVALEYRAPLWSEQHWRLVEKSFALLGEIGNKVVCLPMICRTNFGNAASMVRWVKEGDKYKYDFTVFDRYLDLALKYLKPDVVWLYVWDKYTGESRWAGRGDTEGKGALVTLHDPATGKSEEVEGPRLGTPEGKAFWEPVYKEVRARLEKRGLLGVTMMGTNGDAYWPTKAITEMFKEIMPGTKWINSSHGDSRGRSMNGIPIGYNTEVYNSFFPPPGQARRDRSRDGYFYGWMYKTDRFPRSWGAITGGNPLYPVSPLALHRTYCEACLMGNDSGLGRIGADFWPVLEPPKKRTKGKRSDTINARFPESCWNQLNMNTATEALLALGANGAVSTERFEQIREGIQDCEARIFIEKALLDPALKAKLGDQVAKACREVLDERAWMIRAACIGKGPGFGWYEKAGEPLRERLFAAAAEVARASGLDN